MIVLVVDGIHTESLGAGWMRTQSITMTIHTSRVQICYNSIKTKP